MVLRCPACSRTFAVPEGVTTGKANCPQCGQRLDLGRIFRPGDLQQGTVLGGCRIEGLLGRGGMAVVYKATQLSLERSVALKVLPTRFAGNEQFVERFSREASALARLAHPNIVSILDKGHEGNNYYFVMEYVEGKTLRDHLLREGTFSPQETLELIQEVCAGLAYAHENGVIHRDLKPGNILLDATGTPKLADFGIARMVGTDTREYRQLTQAHTVMGSSDYMSPEQREDAAGVDHRSDIYSLGVMTYQMLTGQLPVGTFKPASRVVPGVPTAVDRVIRTALANAPEDRYDSVGKFVSALSQAFADTSMRSGQPSAPRRHGSSVGVIAIVAIGAIAVVVAVILATAPSPKKPTPSPRPDTTTVARPKTPPPRTPTVVQSKVPEKTPVKEAPPDENSPAVRQALADVRRYIEQNPDEFPGQIERLKAIVLAHTDPGVEAAARKELTAAIGRLDRAIANHLGGLRKASGALLEKRQFPAAIKVFGSLPPSIATAEARKLLQAAETECRGKCWTAYNRDAKQALTLFEAGKALEAIALLDGIDYGIPELNKEAAAEIEKYRKAAAAQEVRIRQEQTKLRGDLAAQLKVLWAERQYGDALARVNDVLAKTPAGSFRTALEPHLRAATLLAAFWKAVLEAAQARKGQFITVSGVKYTVTGLDGEQIVLALPVGNTKRNLHNQIGTDDLYAIVRDWLDMSKKADDNLMVGLFFTYESKPDPAAAARAFDKALALGAPAPLVAAMRDLSSAPGPVDVKEPQPKETEPAAGFAIDLNGTSDYIDVPDDRRERSLRPKSFTLEAWMWRRPGRGEDAEQYVVAKNAGWTTSLSYGIFVREGMWGYATGDGIETDVVVTRERCPTAAWVHVALTYDEGLRALFVDGKPVHNGRAKRRIGWDDKPLYVGAASVDGNPACFWRGGIDQVRLSFGVRYAKQFPPERQLHADKPTLLLLHMDEGKGLRVKDASRYENTGQLRGAARFLPPGDFKVAPPVPPKGEEEGPPVPQPPVKGGPPPKAGPPPKRGPGQE